MTNVAWLGLRFGSDWQWL